MKRSLLSLLVAVLALVASQQATASAETVHQHKAPFAYNTPCVVDPGSCGFPDASSTGVPAGTVLTPSGSLVITTPGTVVTDLDIHGSLEIAAANVEVSNTRITSSSANGDPFVVEVDPGFGGIVITDSEFSADNSSRNPSLSRDQPVGIGGLGYFTAQRLNVHDVTDGIHLHSGTSLTDRYVHNLASTLYSHTDATQIIDNDSTDITLKHNTLLAFNTDTLIYNNSALICGSNCTSANYLDVENNLMDGGSRTLYCPGDNGAQIANNTFSYNTFGLDYFYTVTNDACGFSGNQFVGNTYDGSGDPVPVKDKTHDGRTTPYM